MEKNMENIESNHDWLEWNLLNTSTKTCGKWIQSATVFYDLSSKVYATDICIYINTIKSDKITVSLVFSKARNCTEEETYHSKARTDVCTNWYKEPTFCGKNTKSWKDNKMLKRYYGQILNVYYSGSRTDRTCPFL